MFLQPCCKIRPHQKSCNIFWKTWHETKKKLQLSQSVPLHLKPSRPLKVPSCVSKCLECSNSGDMFKYVALLIFFPCTASWLQMAAVCSGQTVPAVGVGRMLTSLAASVGETAPHSYRRWRARWGEGLMGGTSCIVSDKRNECFSHLFIISIEIYAR